MANYKKKNGNRKREKLRGFRWMRNLVTASGDFGSWRIGGLIRRHIRQSSQASED